MSDHPQTTCPKCGHLEDDHDGFGVLYCEYCGYCTHPSITDETCDLCRVRSSHDRPA